MYTSQCEVYIFCLFVFPGIDFTRDIIPFLLSTYTKVFVKILHTPFYLNPVGDGPGKKETPFLVCSVLTDVVISSSRTSRKNKIFMN